MDVRHRDADWLEQKYVDEGLTTYEMAELADVSDRTIQKWMERHGIERRSSAERQSPDDARYKDEEWLREEYVGNHRSMGDIAAECGVSKQTIRRWMDKFDIDRRDPHETEYGESFHQTAPFHTTGKGYEQWNSLGDCVYVHKLVAVAEYGLEAVKDAHHVHHINGCPFDNRPDNLVPVTDAEHRRQHYRKPNNVNKEVRRKQRQYRTRANRERTN